MERFPYSTVRTTTASSSGRICFGGESLDWMIGGSSIVGAIEMRTRVKVTTLLTSERYLLLQSEMPALVEDVVNLDQIGTYTGHTLDYMHAAVNVVRKTGIKLNSLHITAITELPLKAGLSSSAALANASIAALLDHYEVPATNNEICRHAYKVEGEELKTGAGQMDFYGCGIGGIIYMNCSSFPPNPIEQHNFLGLKVIVVDTLTKHPTIGSGSNKRKRFKEKEPYIMKYVNEAPILVEEMRDALKRGQIEDFSHYVTKYHCLLENYMQNTTPLINECVKTCLENGAVGAKLTGSGFGGCMFALVKESEIDKVMVALQKYPVKVYGTEIAELGIVNETCVSETQAFAAFL